MGTFLFISGQEIFVIMIVVLLLFGADKIPEFAKTIGKGMRDFKKASDEIRREIEISTRDIRNEMSDIQNTVTREVNDISENVQKNIDDTTGTIKSDFQAATNDFQKNIDDVADSINSDYQQASDGFQNQVNDINQADGPVTDDYNYSMYDYHNYSEDTVQKTEPDPGIQSNSPAESQEPQATDNAEKQS